MPQGSYSDYHSCASVNPSTLDSCTLEKDEKHHHCTITDLSGPQFSPVLTDQVEAYHESHQQRDVRESRGGRNELETATPAQHGLLCEIMKMVVASVSTEKDEVLGKLPVLRLPGSPGESGVSLIHSWHL